MIEHYKFIAGRYRNEPQRRVDYFVLAAAWFSLGVIAGLIIAGVIAGITY